jgi:hypothetical protein
VFEPLKSALLDAEVTAGDLLDAQEDAVTVLRAEVKRPASRDLLKLQPQHELNPPRSARADGAIVQDAGNSPKTG